MVSLKDKINEGFKDQKQDGTEFSFQKLFYLYDEGKEKKAKEKLKRHLAGTLGDKITSPDIKNYVDQFDFEDFKKYLKDSDKRKKLKTDFWDWYKEYKGVE